MILKPVFNQITLIEEKKKTPEYEGNIKEVSATGFMDIDGVTATAKMNQIVVAGGNTAETDPSVHSKMLLGDNFGAGMTGGMAFAFDKEGTLPLRINLDDVFYQQQMTPYWEDVLKNKITTYFNETNSQHAKDILDNWDRDKYLFWQIIPKEMVNKFEEPVLVETTKTA